MIVNVPIESLEDRYSADWNKWFAEYTDANEIPVKTIYPPVVLRDTIKEGEFLDVVSTTCFKADQIGIICSQVDKGNIPRDEKVVFLIQDGWFPVEQLAYLRDMLGCHYWKFVGIFHAGTYSKWDLTARSHMYQWGEALENSWFKIYDKIIVGSNHHKRLLLETRNVPDHKIQVILWPVKVPVLDTKHKENIVVFPHRLNVEKQPELFDWLARECSAKGWWFKRTVDECATKQEYYELLAKSKIAVSLGLEELFGIAMVEATLLGCVPLVPDAFSYKEVYNESCRYHDIKALVKKLQLCMEHIETKTGTQLPLPLELFNAYYGVNYMPFYETLFKVMEEV